MQPTDRRSGNERRRSPRYRVELPVEWEGSFGRRPGTLSDVSYDGCFILSSGDVQDGEPVRILIPLTDGMKVQFEGLVANHVLEIGFGVNFSTLSGPQMDLINSLIEQAE